MSLPIPILDDRTFEELVEEARKLIPIYAPQWTDHNLSDPGMTLVDLFAWLSEMQLYSLDVISEAHLLKYLALLGMKSKPKPASPARVELQMTPISSRFITIPKGTAVNAGPDSSTSAITFETEIEIQVIPVELKKVISYSNYRYTDVTEFNDHPATFYHAFGKEPKGGEALYLGMAAGTRPGDLAGKEVRLAVYPYEDDLLPVGEGLPGEEPFKLPPDIPPLAKLTWEFWDGDEWKTLEVKASADTAAVFSGKGYLSIALKAGICKGTPLELAQYFEFTEEFLWVRCKLMETSYEIPPRIDRILPNMVPAVEGQAREEVWESSGLPFQVFKTQKSPVVVGSQKVIIEDEGEDEDKEWEVVPDFDASGPEDMHYVLKAETGAIHFGDGLNGAVPPKEKTITISFRAGGGIKGNVEAGAINLCSITGITVTNPYAAHGGEDAETIDDAFDRLKKEMRIPYTAVTAEDYEYIARSTPGLRVARAQAVISSEINKVTVVVIPYSFEEKPVPGDRFKQIVCRYLDLHRLVTTAIEISEPDYVKVAVKTAVKVKTGYDPDQIKTRIHDALDCFLSPLKRDSGDNEWPFGRTVYASEVNEVLEDVDGVDCVDSLSLTPSGGTFKKKEGNIEIGPLSLVYPGTHEIEIVDPFVRCKEKI